MTSETAAQLNRIQPHALNSREAVANTYHCAEQVITDAVEGIWIECGVGSGAQVAVMHQALKAYGVRRPIHLFDSFQGIPLCGPEDWAQPGFETPPTHDVHAPIEERLVSSGITVSPLENVQKLLPEMGCPLTDLVFHPGWFQHTLPEFKSPPIALLRIDADLYESIEVCLRYLLPHVVKGGIVIIDDYGPPGDTGPRKAVAKHFSDVSKISQVVNDGPAWWTVQ